MGAQIAREVYRAHPTCQQLGPGDAVCRADRGLIDVFEPREELRQGPKIPDLNRHPDRKGARISAPVMADEFFIRAGNRLGEPTTPFGMSRSTRPGVDLLGEIAVQLGGIQVCPWVTRSEP